MIATPHAALLLLNAWNMQASPEDRLDVHFAISQMLLDRRTLSSSRVVSLKHAWILTTKSELSDLEVVLQKVEEDLAPSASAEFRWPDDVYWSNAFGLQPLHKLRQQRHDESMPPLPSPTSMESKSEGDMESLAPGTRSNTSSIPRSSDEAPTLPTESPQLEFLLQAPQEAPAAEPTATSDHKRKHLDVIEVEDTTEENTATSPSQDRGQAQQDSTKPQRVSTNNPLGDNTATPKLPHQTPTAYVTPYLIPGEYGTLTIYGTVQACQLSHLWSYETRVVHADTLQLCAEHHTLAGQYYCIPSTMIQADPPQEIPFEQEAPILFQDYDQAKFFLVSELLDTYFQGTLHLYDQYGEVPTFKHTAELWVVTAIDLPMTIQFHIDHWINVTQTVKMVDTDHLVCLFEGPMESIENVLMTWFLAASQDWQTYHARRPCLQTTSDHQARLVFNTTGKKFATPAIYLLSQIAFRIVRNQFQAMATEDGLVVIIKYLGRELFQGYMDPQRQVGTFHKVLSQAFWPIHHGRSMAIISQAHSLGDRVRLFELTARDKDNNPHPVVLYLQPPQQGGVNVGSKKEHHHLLHTKLAELFHQSGISAKVEDLIRQYGTSRITHLLFSQSGADKWSDFRKLCQEAHVELPSQEELHKMQQGKFQKLAKHQANKARQDPDVSEFQLRQGYFQYNDGSPAQILTAITPWTRGICLMDMEQAAPWLREVQEQSPDELAIFVIGADSISSPLPWQVTSVPAINNKGQQVILQGVLLQLGEETMRMQHTDASVKLTATRICSITLWQDEFPPDHWTDILRAPVKEAKALLPVEIAQYIRNPWGRSFRSGDKTVHPEQATSLQFHVEVANEILMDLLRPSGYNKVHVVPRNQHGHPAEDYAIIWTDGDSATLQAKAGRLPGQAGFVRGKKRHGVRFEQNAYQAAWEKLRPGEELPTQGSYPMTFRIEPLPLGVDAQILRTWAKEVKWDVKPLKNQGPRRWLVAAAAEPPSYVCFNGQILLITKLDRKAQAHFPPVLIGPQGMKKFSADKPDGLPATSHEGVDKLQINDPWQNFRPAHSAGRSKPVAYHPEPPRPPRQEDNGPVAQTLTRQDQHLLQLEQSVQEIKVAQQQSAQSTEHRILTLESNLNSFQVSTTQVMGDFRKSLQEAVSTQQTQLQDTLLQVKQLFIRGQKRTARSPAPSESLSPQGDDDM